ncbi:hypothetical protein DL89DRAFT_15165 [Linderina pennispora]|uniref:Uncharacterized protein n=1 Tax=Linderina pennispora TaxID=61395 RepID=A0A1Y1WLX9_9FUNG|nr:uncharacterized protein DL89DRAFT_15165 [Linderina pennispora]ORX74375.1 hypothetical protein DL89DRAFT_15165 [Linderina pennispora]
MRPSDTQRLRSHRNLCQEWPTTACNMYGLYSSAASTPPSVVLKSDISVVLGVCKAVLARDMAGELSISWNCCWSLSDGCWMTCVRERVLTMSTASAAGGRHSGHVFRDGCKLLVCLKRLDSRPRGHGGGKYQSSSARSFPTDPRCHRCRLQHRWPWPNHPLRPKLPQLHEGHCRKFRGCFPSSCCSTGLSRSASCYAHRSTS